MKKWALLFVLLAAACGLAKPVATPLPPLRNWHQSRTAIYPREKRLWLFGTDSITSFTYDGMDTSSVGRKITPQLWIRCSDNKVDIYVATSAFLGLGHEQPLSFRLEGETLQGQSNISRRDRFGLAGLSEDNTAFFLTGGAFTAGGVGYDGPLDSADWLRAMSKSERLEVRFALENHTKSRRTLLGEKLCSI